MLFLTIKTPFMRWAVVAACTFLGCQAVAVQSSDEAPETVGAKERGSVVFSNQSDDFKFSKFDDDKGVILFKANLEGEDVWAMIDTGSDYSLVSDRLVKKLNLRKERSDISINTILSAQNTNRLPDLNFQHIGQYSMTRDFYSFDFSAISKSLDRQVDVLIGYDLLRQLSFVLDSKYKRILVLPSGMITPADGRYRAIHLENGIFRGNLNGVAARFAVDLGSNGEISVYRHAWEKIFGDEPTVYRGTATDGSGLVRKTRGIEDVHFEAFGARSSVFVTKKPRDSENFDAQVGYSMFYGRVAIFDYPKNVIYVEKKP